MTGDAILVAGSAGTGKTTLGLQFLVNGAMEFQENGVFLTFEQLPEKIYRDAANYGWNLNKLEEEDKLRVVCTPPDLLLKEGKIDEIVGPPLEETRAKRFVVDSISHLELYIPERVVRKEAYRLANYLRTRGLTTLLTSEVHEVMGTSLTITGSGVSFLVDAIVLLRYGEIESSIRRALAIMKMRGRDHDKKLREYEITGTGLRVLAPFTELEGVLSGSPRKSIAVGLEDLQKAGLLGRR